MKITFTTLLFSVIANVGHYESAIGETGQHNNSPEPGSVSQKRVLKYDSELGYTFNYPENWTKDIGCVGEEGSSACPTIVFSTTEPPGGQIEIGFWPGEPEEPNSYFEERKRNAQKDVYHVQEIKRNNLNYTLFLMTSRESAKYIETDSGVVLWSAKSYCNGHQLDVTFDYYPRPSKPEREKLRVDGKPPQSLLTLLNNLNCENVDSLPKEKVFKSPLGLVDVKIQAQIVKAGASKKANGPSVSSQVRYNLTFIKSGHSYDMSWDHPTEGTPHIDNVFKGIQWSPREKMAFFAGKIISLEPGTPWRTSKTELWNRTWIDDWHAVGEVHGDCDFRVLMFDGKAGADVKIGSEKSPVAYALLEKPTAEHIRVKKFEDNCAMSIPGVHCFEYKLEKSKLIKIQCPKGIDDYSQ
ncbi:MAG: hypothetical protein ACM3MG_00265 [Bacillota bacterium]